MVNTMEQPKKPDLLDDVVLDDGDSDYGDGRFQNLTEQRRALVLRLRESVAEAHDGDTSAVDVAMCRRYLTGHNWSLESAQSHLLKTLHWREKEKPDTWECHWCVDNTGRHSMRQIGFDRYGRTVLYTSFIQCAHNAFSAEESVQHMVFLLENGIRSMQHRYRRQSPSSPRPTETTSAAGAAASARDEEEEGEEEYSKYAPEKWVVVLDCTGMSLAACNPRIASAVAGIIGDHYPERLGTVVTLNAGYLMRYAWSAIKVFLPPTMTQKLIFINSDEDYKKVADMFDTELMQWIGEEERLNRQSPFPEQQRQFWKGPNVELMTEDAMAAHDPRGTQTYVVNYLDTFGKDAQHDHQPHPNIAVELREAM